MKNKYRIYVDTSVIGGCFDDEFSIESKKIINAAKAGNIVIVLSDTVFRELAKAPQTVQNIIPDIPSKYIERLSKNKTVEDLRDLYMSLDILPKKYKDDAEHVAFATIARVDAIVSWNFKHLVRFDKIKAFNHANLQNGYGMIQIVSPKEVVFDE